LLEPGWAGVVDDEELVFIQPTVQAHHTFSLKLAARSPNSYGHRPFGEALRAKASAENILQAIGFDSELARLY